MSTLKYNREVPKRYFVGGGNKMIKRTQHKKSKPKQERIEDTKHKTKITANNRTIYARPGEYGIRSARDLCAFIFAILALIFYFCDKYYGETYLFILTWTCICIAFLILCQREWNRRRTEQTKTFHE